MEMDAMSLELDYRPGRQSLKFRIRVQLVNQLQWRTQLKCLYTNAQSMGNKQEELQVCVCLQTSDLTGITDTWLDGSHNWNVGIDRYKLFRKDRQRKSGGSVALYINDQLQLMKLHVGMDEELTESLRFRVKGKAGGDIVVGFCYRLPDQEDRVDEALYKQIGAMPYSQNMALRGATSTTLISVVQTTQQGTNN